jgi:hypothetical protein
MNIFVLARDPTIAAQSLCDKHVPKMVLESAQLLCSVFPPDAAPYRRTHYNHPCAKWVRASNANYFWLLMHALSLCYEFQFRYGHPHKSSSVIAWCQNNIGGLVPRGPSTPHVQAMPDKYKHRNAVTAYRRYYIGEKASFAKWEKGRPPPKWWPK